MDDFKLYDDNFLKENKTDAEPVEEIKSEEKSSSIVEEINPE
jgi:hypothetical protein